MVEQYIEYLGNEIRTHVSRSAERQLLFLLVDVFLLPFFRVVVCLIDFVQLRLMLGFEVNKKM